MLNFLKRSSLLCAAVLLGCVKDPPAFDLRQPQQAERESAREVRPAAKNPLPTTLENPYLLNPDGTVVRKPATTAPTTGPALENDVILRLPLQELIHRAVLNNLDVKVAGYQPAIDETRVTEAEARWDPAFFLNTAFQRTDRESGQGFGSQNGYNIASQTGVRQNLPSGGQAELRYETGWTEPRTLGTTFPPTRRPQFWDNNLVLELTQPLLRDFGNEINRARIVINRNNQRISLLEFRKQLEATVSDLERVYWQLVAAERNVRIAERFLEQTELFAEVLQKRLNQDVTRLLVSQANSSVESRKTALISAKARVRDLSDQLKALINDPDLPVTSAVLILPVPGAASEEPITFDTKDQIDTAMDNRFELGQQQLRIDTAFVAQRVAKNNLLPQLNFVGTLGIQGLDPDLPETIEEQIDTNNLNYSLGFQLTIPLGNREARAIYRRADLQRMQEQTRYAAQIASISLDVKLAVRAVDTAWQTMVSTRQAGFAALDALSAIEQREQGGEALTPTFVQLKLDAQERVAIAASNQAEAIANYNIAISQLELKKGTLLRYDNIVMEEENLPLGYQPK